MGSVTSVEVSPEEVQNDERNENENAVSVFRGRPESKTIEIRLKHFINADDREAREREMGATIQYLAEENARLSLANRELTKRLGSGQGPGGANDVLIYGETTEQKLARVEQALESERREKWEAIENCERIRVDLVNKERELGKAVERLKAEKEDKRKQDTDMDAFKADLSAKREIRQKAIAEVSAEMKKLREELNAEREKRLRLGRERDDAEEVQSLKTLVAEVRSALAEEKRKHEQTRKEKRAVEEKKEEREKTLREMELEKERMWEDYDREKVEVTKRTTALKDVINISRQMLVIREGQVQELKKKLREIEEAVSCSKLPDQSSLKAEYEKQLHNIKNLKELYEERVRLMEMERDKLKENIADQTKTIEVQKMEIEDLREKCGTTSEELKNEKYQNDGLERDLRLSVAKSKDLENELSLINNLFTQMLLGPYNTGSETDLDKLTELLQENHDLITELTLRENSSEIASALPKLLLDLITQVDSQDQSREMSEVDSASEQGDSVAEGAVLPILSYKKAIVFEEPSEEIPEELKSSKPIGNVNPAVKEIASNLPKVWRVLMELLSHHTVPDGPPPGDEIQCYKNVETPSGTRSVISVSNTFIRLKDLILEKKALQKELTRLKQLNSHLESRLDDQEKRLSHVQCELHKTWGVVGRMRAQHQQLHNHEKILRYELQEKRIMLSELKQELEYCRDKWERARQKNDESESEWQKLRREFAARKSKGHPSPNLNDSGESGYSDEQNESGEEVDNFDADRSGTQSPSEVMASREVSVDGEKDEAGTSTEKDERVRLREERLRRLEDQCKLLVRKVDITTSKSNYLSNRLEELHEQYGSSSTQRLESSDEAPGNQPNTELRNQQTENDTESEVED